MLGAILGDIMGSYYELHPKPRYTPDAEMQWGDYSDDTVLTVATMDALLRNKEYAKCYRSYYMNDQDRGFGRRFSEWAKNEERLAYGSYGNGAAMRISPIGFTAENERWLEKEVRCSVEVSHNHPDALNVLKP